MSNSYIEDILKAQKRLDEIKKRQEDLERRLNMPFDFGADDEEEEDPDGLIPVTEQNRKKLLYSTQLFNFAKRGDRVKVHLNLGVKLKSHGMKTWSIRDASSSRVVGHEESLILKDCKFLVSKGTAKKIDEGADKTPHAFVEGRLVTSTTMGRVPRKSGDPIYYNPQRGMTSFCYEERGFDMDPECGRHDRGNVPIYTAQEVYFGPNFKIVKVR